MAKLYPPVISGTIPAFSGTVITVPFSMNRAVSYNEFSSFSMKIKTVSGELKTTITSSSYDKQEMEVYFDVDSTLFNVGQYYKLQIAYINKNDEVGYYSTVGVIKYTCSPDVYIEGLSYGKTNNNTYSYEGIYSQEDGDSTEKLYSSRFILYDEEMNIIKDSGDILHNISEDTSSYEAHESFSIAGELEENQIYYLRYETTSVNGLITNSKKYRISQLSTVDADLNTELIAELQFDDGYIKLTFDTDEKALSGNILISRASSLNNWAWEEIKRFSLHSVRPDSWYYNDFIIEQGATYKYSIQQYNKYGIYSNRIVSEEVYADMEDTFLCDGERQLKVRFNPKVSTYKTDILETKTDTIGSKYPYFVRNGRTSYKEFAISGLISYQSDPNQLFMDLDEAIDDYYRITSPHSSQRDSITTGQKTDLTSDNILLERLFKNEVLTWLQNGKPKIFKSGTEGTYLVRLMNISSSPTDQLGRMLHTFTSTAYEIDELNITTLNYYDIIDASEFLPTETVWRNIVLSEVEKSSTQYTTIIPTDDDSSALYELKITDMMPGSLIRVDGEAIEIGATGAFYYKSSDTPIKKLEIQTSNLSTGGNLIYSYQEQTVWGFNLITELDVTDVPSRQFIGTYKTNILDLLQDARTTILKPCWARFEKRNISYLFMDEQSTQILLLNSSTVTPSQLKLYYDINLTQPFINANENIDSFTIYRLRATRNQEFKYDDSYNEGYWISAINETAGPYTNYYIDGYDNKIYKWNNQQFISSKISEDAYEFTLKRDYLLQNSSDEFKQTIDSMKKIADSSFGNLVTLEVQYYDENNKEQIKQVILPYNALYEVSNESNNFIVDGTDYYRNVILNGIYYKDDSGQYIKITYDNETDTFSHEYSENETYYFLNTSTDIFKIFLYKDEDLSIVDIEDKEEYFIDILDEVDSIIPGSGIISEISYIQQIKHYIFEKNNSEVKSALEQYLSDQSDYIYYRENPKGNGDYCTESEVLSYYNTMKNSYETFNTKLAEAKAEYEQDYGVTII